MVRNSSYVTAQPESDTGVSTLDRKPLMEREAARSLPNGNLRPRVRRGLLSIAIGAALACSAQGVAALTPITGAGDWGDYDNDGDLDIVLAGYRADWSGTTEIWTNDGACNFSKADTTVDDIFAVLAALIVTSPALSSTLSSL